MTVEGTVRAMSKAERRDYLRARGWADEASASSAARTSRNLREVSRLGSSWRSPDATDRGFYGKSSVATDDFRDTLAAAIRTAVETDQKETP